MPKLGAVLIGIVIVVVLTVFVPPTTVRLQINLATPERMSLHSADCHCAEARGAGRRSNLSSLSAKIEPLAYEGPPPPAARNGTLKTLAETRAQEDNQPVLFLPLVCNRGASFRLFLPFVYRPALPPATCPTRTPGPPLPRPTQPPSIIPTPPPSPLATPVTIR